MTRGDADATAGFIPAHAYYPDRVAEDVARYKTMPYGKGRWRPIETAIASSWFSEAAFSAIQPLLKGKRTYLIDFSSHESMPSMTDAAAYRENIALLTKVMAYRPELSQRLLFMPPSWEELQHFISRGFTKDPTLVEGTSGFIAVCPSTLYSTEAEWRTEIVRELVHVALHDGGFRYQEHSYDIAGDQHVLHRRGWFAHGSRVEENGQIKAYWYEGKGIDEAITVWLENELLGSDRSPPALSQVNQQMTHIISQACGLLAKHELGSDSPANRSHIMNDTLVKVYRWNDSDINTYRNARKEVAERFDTGFREIGREDLTFVALFTALDKISCLKYIGNQNYRFAIAKQFSEGVDGIGLSDPHAFQNEHTGQTDPEKIRSFLLSLQDSSRDYTTLVNQARHMVGLPRLQPVSGYEIAIPHAQSGHAASIHTTNTLRR